MDENKLPLIGASVRVKGNAQGAMTDANGAFAIKGVDSEAILIVSYVGYQQKEVKAGLNLTINLSLDNSNLTEVTVIGYGTQKRSEVTGSISNVKGSDAVSYTHLDVYKRQQKGRFRKEPAFFLRPRLDVSIRSLAGALHVCSPLLSLQKII